MNYFYTIVACFVAAWLWQAHAVTAAVAAVPTRCAMQAGETLIRTYWVDGGMVCQYSGQPVYAMALKVRRAR